MATISTTGKIRTGAHVNEYVALGGGRYAQRYSIPGTSILDYQVWERLERDEAGRASHSTQTHHETYGWLGALPARALPAELDALPVCSAARSAAVNAYFDELHAREEALIRATWPADFAD